MPAEAGLSKLNSMRDIEVDVVLGEPSVLTDLCTVPDGTGTIPSKGSAPTAVYRRYP
jgi:hypothetical protein